MNKNLCKDAQERIPLLISDAWKTVHLLVGVLIFCEIISLAVRTQSLSRDKINFPLPLSGVSPAVGGNDDRQSLPLSVERCLPCFSGRAANLEPKIRLESGLIRVRDRDDLGIKWNIYGGRGCLLLTRHF